MRVEALGRISGDMYDWAQSELVTVATNAFDSDVALKAFGRIDDNNQKGLVNVTLNANLDSIAKKAVKKIDDENLLKSRDASPFIDSEIKRRERAKESQAKIRPQRSLNAKPQEIFEALLKYVSNGSTHEEAIIAVAGDYDVPRFKVSRLYRRNNWKDRLDFNQS